VLGLGEVTGRLAPGYSADLLVVAGDPLKNLGALGDVELVLAAGRAG
jgi:imidazolonepropionase-like amidohydrolase